MLVLGLGLGLLTIKLKSPTLDLAYEVQVLGPWILKRVLVNIPRC